MAENFLTKTTLDREAIVEVSGRSALESYAALRELVATRVSEEAATVLANRFSAAATMKRLQQYPGTSLGRGKARGWRLSAKNNEITRNPS